jgi:hypothetical protein
MRNMLDRAMHYMEQDMRRAYTLTELRIATGIAIRSQYRLSEQLLDSGMVVLAGGRYRIADYLVEGFDQ